MLLPLLMAAGGLWSPLAHATPPPIEARVADVEAARQRFGPVQPGAAEPPGGFTFVGLIQARASAANLVNTNPFLDGQVIGSLGGSNGTRVLDPAGMDLDGDGEDDPELTGARVVEQRTTGFFSYAPPVLEGRVGLTAAFEVDFLYGDRSYGTGGNTGGGVGGDQVNLQTRRMHATFRPAVGAGHELVVHAGLQFLADGVSDPTAVSLDDLVRSGAGLRLWGTEAAGVAAYGRVHDGAGDRLRYRVGAFSLYENGAGLRDDAWLAVADFDVQTTWRSHAGVHAWLLRDYSGGQGGALGLGPTSTLSDLQGGPSLDLRGPDGEAVETDGDLLWLAVDGGFNHRLDRGPLGASAVAAWNVGKLYVSDQPDVLVRGWMLDAEARLRWASGAGSVVRVEALASSRDGTGPAEYTGMVTGNSYGIVGAVWASHGMLLLFQDPGAINRSTPVAFDVSNGGDGLLAVTGGVGWDAVPNRLTVQANAGHGRDGLGEALGTELGGRLIWHPVFGTQVGIAVATVTGSRFVADPRVAMLFADALLF